MPNAEPPAPGAGIDVPAALLDQIRADAAERAGVAPSEVRVISSSTQTWNDGSLGCPKPGEFYIQMLVDGFQVLVQAGDRTFDYHTSRHNFRLCED